MAAGYSSAAVTMGHLTLKRAIRHAEANDLVARNVAALADTPKSQDGRPSKSLTLDQTVAVITAARCSPATWAPRWTRETSARCSSASAPRPGKGTAGHRELRTTFVSLLSHSGISIEEIARLAGHASTRTTEIVYRRELRPVITTGAEIMDELFTGT
jgi:hypothetical protein